MKTIIGILVALVVLAGVGAFVLLHQHPAKDSSATSASQNSPAQKQSDNSTPANDATPPPVPDTTTAPSSSTSTASGSGSTAPSTETFTVSANDDNASPESINVKKGDTVKITFKVEDQGTYHGGLQFKNADLGLDSGPIAVGSSGTVSFTAGKSFKFTPYWYQSSVQKDYFVTVNVQ
ncbi:MAG TPA: hypothetical protein VLF69_01315 [Candidatus Saccharimonadales bacterium]|nr:hypothetical protein [Candidatus Saccharimonadales bacterium]